MSKTMIIRVQSPEHGTKRIETKGTEKASEFFDKVQYEFNLPDFGWKLFKNRDKTEEIKTSRSKTVTTYALKHGDMLYLWQNSATTRSSPTLMDTSSTTSLSNSRPGTSDGSRSFGQQDVLVNTNVEEDEVDQFISKLDGRIPRKRNEQLCRHGPAGKCFHCVPLEPYDEKYLQSLDPPIKFLSFHSNIRKMTGGVDKGKFAILENLSCRIKPGCKEHPPWPGGICTKCQPNAVTLNRQKYRHVDYIQFENPMLMERFLNFWRSTGAQRIGIMYGRYEHHKDIPLGIKAVVAAIYEPPQESTKNSVRLLEDEQEESVNEMAAVLGLRPVGWIFTDLVAADLQQGTVKHFRGNINSHFLSAEECITAAYFQNKYPNPCKMSPDGQFGSKFVTVVVTGDAQNQIHFEGYQVSNQCMALVRDECLVPTKDAPELGYVKQSTNDQYVPDVFYKEIDEYKNEVTQLARPLPVEYLLLDMPAAFPVEPLFSLPMLPADKRAFPTENRAAIGEPQDFPAFCTYMAQFSGASPDEVNAALGDFHVLLYLRGADVLPVRDHLEPLLRAVRAHDADATHRWRKEEHWATVEQLMAAHVPSPTMSREMSYVGPNASPLPPIGGGGASWTCAHCTFINPSAMSACEMCTLPKS